MRIGIIGAGRIGSTLARLFVDAGHDVTVADAQGPHSLRGLEAQLGARCRAVEVDEAVRHGDLVVLAIPFGRYRDVPPAGLRGKTVIDTTNYDRQRDGSVPELDDERNTTSSELIQRRLDGAHVVKAFNAVPWGHLRDHGRLDGTGPRYGIAVSGDHADAKRRVSDLVEQLGFAPVDAGGLAVGGRRHQPGTDVYNAGLTADELRSRIGVAPPARRSVVDDPAR